MNLLHVDPDPCGSEHRELARLTDENANLRAAVQAVRELPGKDSPQAPVWLSNEEASAWGSGYAACLADIRRALSTAAGPAHETAARWTHARVFSTHKANPDLSRWYMNTGTERVEAPCVTCGEAVIRIDAPSSGPAHETAAPSPSAAGRSLGDLNPGERDQDTDETGDTADG